MKAKKLSPEEKIAEMKRYKAEYYQKNKLRLIAIQNEWVKNNREKSRAIKKKYFDKNKESIYEKRIEKKKANPEIFAAHQKKYTLKYPEKIKAARDKWNKAHPEYYSEYLKANPEKFRLASTKRRGRKKSNSTPEQIIEADLFAKKMAKNKHITCPYCEFIFDTRKMHIDHIFPLARGGSHSKENITITCKKCNLSKGDKIFWEEWIPPYPANYGSQI